jgi:hypothetical protein
MSEPVWLDNLVVAAASLAEGVAWCEATLGITPGAGGEHALFGTHNRLLRLACAEAPNAYLEIIAIQPGRAPTRPPPQKRWFDLDDPALRTRLERQGPQLVHWVASVPDLAIALARWRTLGIERGFALAASRPTANGLLQWQISVREDGRRLFDGALPTLIQWGDTHPANTMPDSGIGLSQLTLTHPEAPRLREALDTIGLSGPTIATGAPNLQAELQTPRGPVTLVSRTDNTP